jgi:hypothetical protein
MMERIPIQPDPEDFAAVDDVTFGPLAYDASEKQTTERYRLTQAAKLSAAKSPLVS